MRNGLTGRQATLTVFPQPLRPRWEHIPSPPTGNLLGAGAALEEKNMSEFEIERGVPVPEMRGRPTKYPLTEMGVGDSFFVPLPDGITKQRLVNRLSSAAGYWRKHHDGGRFCIRAVDGGVRIWRFE